MIGTNVEDKGPCEAKLCWSATEMMAKSSKGQFNNRDEIVPNRCKLQSLLAVSGTVPVYRNTENPTSGGQIYKTKHQKLFKWSKTDFQDMHPLFKT